MPEVNGEAIGRETTNMPGSFLRDDRNQENFGAGENIETRPSGESKRFSA